MKGIKTPNPGSPEAIEQNCKCPISDNNHGEGFPYPGVDHNVFWITSECPLHGQPLEEQENAVK